MGTNISRVAEVRDLAYRVSQDAIDKMTALGVDSDEDYADALDSVGTLFKWLGAQMLFDTYKNDENEDKAWWDNMLKEAKEKADQALVTLGQFNVTIKNTYDIDTLGE